MKKNQLSFISFEYKEDNLKTFLSLNDYISEEIDYETISKEAKKIYKNSIKKIASIIKDINQYKQKYRRLPARKAWELGDAIFELQNNLSDLSLQIDGLYNHLVRDLVLKRKWLEKVIILRRYIKDKNAITESMNWSKFEKGTKRVSEELYRKYKLKNDI
ncbi:MAG: hypothetical protein ACTSRG_25950 [Candidatus Helarchaeota archaeon]